MRLRSFVCASGHCRTEFRLIKEDGEEHYGTLLLEESRLCPLCGSMHLNPSFTLKEGYGVREITAQDLWLAINGMGMPEERSFDHVQVIEMLVEHAIVYVSATRRRRGRVVINHVVLNNGTRLHFGEGAAIYKIEEDQDARQSSRIRDEDGEARPQEHLARTTGAPSCDVAAD